MNKHLQFFGISITVVTATAFREAMMGCIEHENFVHVITVNPEILVEAWRNREYRNVLRRAEFATADGVGVLLMAKARGAQVRVRERLTGVAVTHLLLRLAQDMDIAVACVLKSTGLTRPDALKAALQKSFPRLNAMIITDREPVQRLIDFEPRIVLVGLGAPDQEFWIHRHRSLIPRLNIACGIGGTFDFISGSIKRAPLLMQHLGLEWLWRLAIQPQRFRRIIRAVIVFPFLALIKK